MVISAGRPVGRVPALLLAVLILIAACTSGSSDQATGNWELVTPAGMAPASLSAGSAGVLVGGASDGPDQHPQFALRRAGAWQNVPATATTAYGGMGTIVHAGMSRDGSIVAIGNVSGGAHLNPRWSAWIGTTSGLTEEQQTVETFGGPEAGGITGVLTVDAPDGPMPLVVGMWSVVPGLTGIATWRHDAALKPSTWVRQPSPPVLAGTKQGLVSATAAVNADPGVMIAGLETTFDGSKVHQRAVVWMSPDAVSWTRVDLDTSEMDSAATDLSCHGGSCVVVGRLDDLLAAWQVIGTIVSPLQGLPARAVDQYPGQPRVATDGSALAIAVGAGDELLSRSASGTWVSARTPAGEAREVGLHDGHLYLLLRPPDGREVLYSRPL
jgi:hypothetical protein